MPWTRENRWPAFLIIAAVALLGIAAGVIISRSRVGGSLNDVERSVVHGCVVIASVIGTGLGVGKGVKRTAERAAEKVKGELVERWKEQRADIRHDTRGEIMPVRLEMMNELPVAVVKTINGGIDKVIERRLDASPFPTTPEQLQQFIKDCTATNCEEVALTAARQAVAEMEKRGWTPPSNLQL